MVSRFVYEVATAMNVFPVANFLVCNDGDSRACEVARNVRSPADKAYTLTIDLRL